MSSEQSLTAQQQAAKEFLEKAYGEVSIDDREEPDGSVWLKAYESEQDTEPRVRWCVNPNGGIPKAWDRRWGWCWDPDHLIEAFTVQLNAAKPLGGTTYDIPVVVTVRLVVRDNPAKPLVPQVRESLLNRIQNAVDDTVRMYGTTDVVQWKVDS